MDMKKRLNEFVYNALFYKKQMNYKERENYFEEKMKEIVDSGKYKRLDIAHPWVEC